MSREYVLLVLRDTCRTQAFLAKNKNVPEPPMFVETGKVVGFEMDEEDVDWPEVPRSAIMHIT